MRAIIKWGMVAVSLVLVLGVMAGLLFGREQKEGGKLYETREETLGEVTVVVTPIGITVGKEPEFQVKFDTHSVDLNLDVSKISLLTDGAGDSLGEPTWEGSPPGGHHLEGKLKFDEPIKRSTNSLKLVFEKVFGGEDIVFTWKID